MNTLYHRENDEEVGFGQVDERVSFNLLILNRIQDIAIREILSF